MSQVHRGHRQRLKARVQDEGLENFQPHQIVEYLLFYSIGRRDTDELAHRLIDRFRTVEGVLHAPAEALLEVEGVGQRTVEVFRAIAALTDSYAALRFEDRLMLKNASDVIRYAEKLREEKPIRSVRQMCLSANGLLHSCAKVCDGLLWGEAANLRRCVVDLAAVCGKNSVIVVLTDDDEATLRDYDVQTAANYGYMLDTMESELLDVLIVSSRDVLSLYRAGAYNRRQFSQPRSLLSEIYELE